VVEEVVLKVLVDQLLMVVLLVVHNLEDGHLMLTVVLLVVVEVSLSTDHLMVEVVEALVLTTQVVVVLVDLEEVDS
jgi:hypothetical protein|tara:strand:+ start:441 stop:668 length:228 start_codon:yes stop_codon:yes gene_type:complete